MLGRLFGSVVWAIALGVVFSGVERIGVRPLWLLFPVSALLTSLLAYLARIPNWYQGGLEREPRFHVWLAQQVVTWGFLALVLWLVRFR
jgi:hypothetical protein